MAPLPDVGYMTLLRIVHTVCFDKRNSFAVRTNDIELVQWFLSHDDSASIRYTRYTLSTLLTYAAVYISFDIVKLLVAHGARADRGDLLASVWRLACQAGVDYQISC